MLGLVRMPIEKRREELKGAEIVKTVSLPQFGATEWTLSNGARVVFKHADYEKDNVTISGQFNAPLD